MITYNSLAGSLKTPTCTLPSLPSSLCPPQPPPPGCFSLMLPIIVGINFAVIWTRPQSLLPALPVLSSHPKSFFLLSPLSRLTPCPSSCSPGSLVSPCVNATSSSRRKNVAARHESKRRRERPPPHSYNHHDDQEPLPSCPHPYH